jgi:hypothetical protein
VFGSIDYVLVDDQVKTKLADKSKKMIFVSNDKKNPKNTSFTTPMKKR